MIDVACGALVLAIAAAALAAYAAHVRRGGASDFARVRADGGSPLLGARVMNGGYWALQPLGRACTAVGLSPDAITLGSVALAAAGAVAFGAGLFGVGALFAALSFLADALDGLVARARGIASDAGEMVDATADRYAEALLLGGIIVHHRASAAIVLLGVAAIVGSFMVSYVTAKAEIARVDAPRGSMRRPERAVYLTLGAALTPLVPVPTGLAPVIVATAAIALVANASAILRARAIVSSLRRVPPASPEPTAPVVLTSRGAEGGE